MRNTVSWDVSDSLLTLFQDMGPLLFVRISGEWQLSPAGEQIAAVLAEADPSTSASTWSNRARDAYRDYVEVTTMPQNYSAKIVP